MILQLENLSRQTWKSEGGTGSEGEKNTQSFWTTSRYQGEIMSVSTEIMGPKLLRRLGNARGLAEKNVECLKKDLGSSRETRESLG